MAFIFTEWDEIKSVTLDKYEKYMNTAVIFDGRNCIDLNEARDSKVDYYSIGRSEVLNGKFHELKVSIN